MTSISGPVWTMWTISSSFLYFFSWTQEVRIYTGAEEDYVEYSNGILFRFSELFIFAALYYSFLGALANRDFLDSQKHLYTRGSFWALSGLFLPVSWLEGFLKTVIIKLNLICFPSLKDLFLAA